jgi:hypothetical protein
LVASYEDPAIRNHVVDITRYPELRRALETGSVVSIPDATKDPSLAGVFAVLSSRRVQSITVVPITWRDAAIGAIFLRTFKDGGELAEQEVEFCRVVADLTARALRQAHHFERLRATKGGGAVAIAAERERAAMLGFLRRFLLAFGDRDGGFDDGLLARASTGELDRLVGVAMTVLSSEAKHVSGSERGTPSADRPGQSALLRRRRRNLRREYDRLFRELEALERRQPELDTEDSPTRRVGAAPATSLHKHQHRQPMLSLANAFDPDELTAWEARNARINAEVRGAGYTSEIKIDGAAVSLTYEKGHFTVGDTRGNGLIGEAITANLKTVTDIPLVLTGKGLPSLMEVRGEVYLPYKSFERLNRDRADAGDSPLPTRAMPAGPSGLDPAKPTMVANVCVPGGGGRREVHPTPSTNPGAADRVGVRVEPHHEVHDLSAVQARIPA